MLFNSWWLGRPEDSFRDYLLPTCAANCSLCSLLLAPPQDSAVRENRRILEGLSFHLCEARAYAPSLASPCSQTNISINRLELSQRKRPRSTTVAGLEVDIPPVKIITLSCNHKFSFQGRSKKLSIRMVNITQQY